MEQKHLKNPEIVDTTKRAIIIIGCPGLAESRCRVCDDIREHHPSIKLLPMTLDNAHPQDQVRTVKRFVLEELNNEDIDPVLKDKGPLVIFTYSPFVLQSFFHFTGRDLRYIAYYECGFNETGELLLTNVSTDTRAAFGRMADALGSIMDMSENLDTQHDAECRPKYIRFTKDIDYWLDIVELDGKTYDQLEDDDAWDNLCKDWPMLADKDKDTFSLTIDIDNGHIVDWPEGRTASFRTVKIVDTGCYELLNSVELPVRRLKGYVPNFLAIEDTPCGDYLEFDVDARGYIRNWKFTDDDLKTINEKWDAV